MVTISRCRSGIQSRRASGLYLELIPDRHCPRAVFYEIDGRHNVSLPFSVYYSTIGNEINYERKQDEVIFSLEARYSYRFTELFSLGAGAGIKGQWHLGTRYLSASAGGSIVPAFTVLDWLSFSVPVSVYGSRNDWSMTVGIGCVFHIMEAFR